MTAKPLTLTHTRKQTATYDEKVIAYKIAPQTFAKDCGITLDDWQRGVFEADAHQICLNCCRQSGKSTVTAMLGLKHALFNPNALVLIISNVYSQSIETFRKVSSFYQMLGRPVRPRNETLSYLELYNNSRILTLSGKIPGNIRGYSASLMIIDEAAQVPDLTYDTMRPSLVVSGGDTILLSTPHGREGFFYDVWHNQDDWLKIRIPWQKCPRLTTEEVERERTSFPSWFFRQEMECSFEEGNQSIINPEAIRRAFKDRPAWAVPDLLSDFSDFEDSKEEEEADS